MATQAEYIAAAKALAEGAQKWIALAPPFLQKMITVHMDEIGKAINEEAVKAVDAAEAARVAETPQSAGKATD